MLKIEFVFVPWNGVKVGDLAIGSVFRVPRGKTPYMRIDTENSMDDRKIEIPSVSLESGILRWFAEEHIVYELEGTLKLAVVERVK